MTEATLPANTGFAGQPIVEIERDGVHYTLLGTAHVSKASIDAVLAAIDSGRFDAVEEVSEQDIERLKEGDMLESSFGEFARDTPSLYATLIDERDQYMAAKLRERADGASHVLAVVGAGHLKGMATYLADEQRAPAELTGALSHVRRKRNIPWITLALMLLICGGIAWGYAQGGADLGKDLLLQWVAWTAGLAGLGALLARGHPLSILAAAVSAPLKPFRPGVPPGMFSALAEVHLRKPAYPDFLALRDDTQTLGGWYRNRVCRAVLVFLLTNLGSMVGVWISGAAIIGKLV